MLRPLAAALVLLSACNRADPDCIDGLEGQLRCFSDAATPSGVELCLDGSWGVLDTCDVAGGWACATCVAEDADVPHACTPCPEGGNSVARCALTAPVLTCR